MLSGNKISKDFLFHKNGHLTIYGFALVLRKYKQDNYFCVGIEALINALTFFVNSHQHSLRLFYSPSAINAANQVLTDIPHQLAVIFEKCGDLADKRFQGKVAIHIIDSTAPDKDKKSTTQGTLDIIRDIKRHCADILPQAVFTCNLTNQQTNELDCGYVTAKNMSKVGEIPHFMQSILGLIQHETQQEGVQMVYYHLPVRLMYLASSPDKIAKYVEENKEECKREIHKNKDGDGENLSEMLERERYWRGQLISPMLIEDRHHSGKRILMPQIIAYFRYKYDAYVNELIKTVSDDQLAEMIWQRDVNSLCGKTIAIEAVPDKKSESGRTGTVSCYGKFAGSSVGSLQNAGSSNCAMEVDEAGYSFFGVD